MRFITCTYRVRRCIISKGGAYYAGNKPLLRYRNQDVFKPKEHEPSHIHALYGEYAGLFDIETAEMTEGDLPVRAQELVAEWVKENKEDLLQMWSSQKLSKLPPLK